MKVYSSLAEIEQEPRLVGYSRILQRAWQELSLSSVLCINDVPTLYRINHRKIVEPDELNRLHRNVWNQGIASVLLIVDPKRVYIFSGMQRPVKEEGMILDKQNPASPLLDDFGAVGFSQKSINQSVYSGQFYKQYTTKFKPSTVVDQTLTQNLKFLREALVDNDLEHPLSESDTHNFICRLLFVCYLQDRGIVDHSEPLHKALEKRNDDDAIQYIYDLFGKSKNVFNGSMFDTDLSGEQKRVKVEHIRSVKAFLRGENPKSKQISLGFWAYDFKFIPIETISAIYENFLTDDDKKKKGAFYTPRFLAEFTVDVAVGEDSQWHERSYLDPSCGSGVFLVTLFNRLVTRWELANSDVKLQSDHYELKDEALRAILRNQICGIDSNSSACMLTCFSLYVALLDSFSPATLREYFKASGFRKLPKLLACPSTSQSADKNYIPIIHVADSLKTELLHGVADVVVGNPPWGGAKRGAGDISIQFLKSVQHFLKPDGTACFLLPSRLFLNNQNESFQSQWLLENTIERIVQLADFRFILFAEASCPCMVLKYNAKPPAEANAAFIYDAPKFNASSRRQGLVLITEADRKSVSQAEMQFLSQNKKAHTTWKQLFWGTPRDLRFLDFLDSFPKLNALFIDRASGWGKGQGFQPDSKGKQTNPKKPWWKSSDLFLDAKSAAFGLDSFLFPEETSPIGTRFQNLYSARESNRVVFTPPMILFNQGFNKFVFSDFPVLFQDSIQSIHAPESDLNLLLFLLAYLKSDLIQYYCFHTSSMLGIERNVVRFGEVLEAPFPLPSDAPAKNAEAIVKRIAERFKEQKTRIAKKRMKLSHEAWLSWRSRCAEDFDRELNELVYKYFDIPEEARWLVEDTVHISLPSSTPSSMGTDKVPTVQSLSELTVSGYEKGVQTYCDTLTSTLNKWAHERDSQYCVNAKGDVNEELGFAYVAVSLSNKIQSFEKSPLKDARWGKLIEMFTEEKVVEQQVKTPFIFEGKKLYILRPSSLIHWTQTAALNDADELFAYLHSIGGTIE